MQKVYKIFICIVVSMQLEYFMSENKHDIKFDWLWRIGWDVSKQNLKVNLFNFQFPEAMTLNIFVESNWVVLQGAPALFLWCSTLAFRFVCSSGTWRATPKVPHWAKDSAKGFTHVSMCSVSDLSDLPPPPIVF